MAKKKAAFDLSAFAQRWDEIAARLEKSGKDEWEHIPKERREQFMTKEILGFTILMRHSHRRESNVYGYIVATVGDETMYLETKVEDVGPKLTDGEIEDLIRCRVRMNSSRSSTRRFEMGL